MLIRSDEFSAVIDFHRMSKNKRYKGLTDSEVLQSRGKHGSNVLTPPQKVSVWKLFLEKFGDPLIVILLVIGIFALGVSFYEYLVLDKGMSAFIEPTGVFIAIFLATGLSFHFEHKAQKEFNVLNQENDNEKVTVIRNRSVSEIPKCDVVVGDILVLQTGQEVPADATLLEAYNLQVDESSLTGEPVHFKTAEAKDDNEHTYPSNHIYRGTLIMEGNGYAEVFAVGDHTENGRIMQSLMGVDIDDIDNADDEKDVSLNDTQKKAIRLHKKNRVTKKIKTPLDEQLGRLGSMIANLSYLFAGIIILGRMLVYFDWNMVITLTMLPLIGILVWLVIAKFKKLDRWKCITIIVAFFIFFMGIVVLGHHSLKSETNISELIAYALETIMIAVTLVVVSVPEGLPMAVSLALATSMRKMLKTNNLVRKMHACETMGACNVICTDKTGTLTKNQMQVKDICMEETDLAFEGIALNSTASLDFTGQTPKCIGNPTEGALLLWLHSKGINYRELKEQAELLEEVPFSTEIKYMASVVASRVNPGKKILYVKGAPELVMSMCKYFPKGHSIAEYNEILTGWQKKAMRTLAFAYMEIDDKSKVIKNGKVVANNLSFLGIVGIEDPIREDVKDAVSQCLNAGIEIKIITGDTMITAKEIGRRIGIWDDDCTDKNIIEGSQLATLSDEELLERIDDLKIITRARPLDKKRLVEILQKRGYVVAVTGDGTNDAPALNSAHVGLSMGSGTNVAKEASDITILDNSFASITRAVKWGRSLFQNIQRFLLYQLTVNVAASLLVICGAFMGTQSPLTVTQMLWVNLIMDTFAAFALSALPPTDRVMHDKPRDRRAFILNRDMIANILGVGLFFFALSVGLLALFQHYDISSIKDILSLSENMHKRGEQEIGDYERTLLFTIFVMTHFWYLFNARGFKTGGSGLNLKGCDGFITISVIIFLGQILIVQTPVLCEFFNATPLKWNDWLIIIGLSSFVMIFREIYAGVKRLI